MRSLSLFLAGGLVLLLTQGAFAQGKSGFTTLCDSEASRTAGLKNAPTQDDDTMSVHVKLKTRPSSPLVLEGSSTVLNSSGFTGGSASRDLVIVPAGHSNFQYFKVPVLAGCKGDPDNDISVVFATGEVPLKDSLDPDRAQHAYEMSQALAGFPDTAWNADAATLFTGICQEVFTKIATPAGIMEMGTATDVSILSAAQDTTGGRCMGDIGESAGTVVRYWDVASNQQVFCDGNTVAAATSDLVSLIADIPAVSVSAATDGSGGISASLSDGTCTVTVTFADLASCASPTAESTGCD